MIRAAELAPSRAGRRRITHAPRQARRKAGTHANTLLCTHTHLNTPLCTYRHTHISSRTVHTYTLQEARTALSYVHTHTDLCKRAQGVCTRLFSPYGLVHNCSTYIPVCAHTSWPYPPASIYLPVHPRLCTPNPRTPMCLHLCTQRVPAVPVSHPCTLSCSPHTHPYPAVPLWGHPAVPRGIRTLPHTPWWGLSTLQRLPGRVG